MADLATLQAQLAEAEKARHELLMGNKMSSITVNGRTVQRTQANIGELKIYINELKAQINRLKGKRNRGPIGFHA